jgi:hypothetical protein
MVSSAKKTKSVSTPVFQETWLPGQKEYIPGYANVWKDIFAGNLESPTAKMLQQTTGEAAMRETAQQRRSIAGTRGLTAPAKAKAMSTLGGTAVSAMAKVPQEIWGAAKEFLSAYSLTPPTVASGTASKSSGGGGWGVCCFIFCATDLDSHLLEMVSRFKDAHYNKLSPIAQGYKRLAIWIVPLMRRYPLVKKIVKALMVHPMSLYAKAFYEEDTLTQALLYPVARFWVSTYWGIGKVCGEQIWRRYFNLLERW